MYNAFKQRETTIKTCKECWTISYLPNILDELEPLHYQTTEVKNISDPHLEKMRISRELSGSEDFIWITLAVFY